MKNIFLILSLCIVSLAQNTTSNLVAGWKTTDGSGTTITDFSSSSNNLTTTNITWTTESTNNLTESVKYNGSTSRADATSQTGVNFDRTNAFTITAWVFLTSSAAQSIIGTLNTSSNFTGWELSSDSTNHISFLLNSVYSTSTIEVHSSCQIGTNIWTHIAATYTGSSAASGVVLYENGNVCGGNTVTHDNLTTSTTNSIKPRLGQRQDASEPIAANGKTGPIYIYSRALSGGDVNQLYLVPYTFASGCSGSGIRLCQAAPAFITNGAISISSGSINLTTGDFVAVAVVAAGTVGTQNIISCTDGTNTYTKLTSTLIGNSSLFSGTTQAIFYLANVTGGTNLVITCTLFASGGGFTGIIVDDFQGVNHTVTVDQQNTSTGSSANPTISVTNSLAPDIILVNFLTNAATQPTFGNMTGEVYSNVGAFFMWTTKSSTGSFTTSLSGGASGNYMYSIASLQSLAGNHRKAYIFQQ